MRALVCLFLTTLFALSFSAQSFGDEPLLWRDHQVKKDEWLFKIAKNLPIVQVGKFTVNEAVKAMIKKNPLLKNPGHLRPGETILVPATVFSYGPNISHTGTVNYNVYVNSNIYMQGGPVVERKVSTVYEAPVVEKVKKITKTKAKTPLKKELKQKRKLSLEFEPGVFFSRIEATQDSNGSSSTQVSELNYGVDIDISHKVLSKYRLHYQTGGTSESYDVGSSSNYRAGLAMSRRWQALQVLAGLGYETQSVLSSESSSLEIVNVGQPRVGANISYHGPKVFGGEIKSELGLGYLMSGTSDDLEVESGFEYKLNFGYERKVFNQSLGISAWWQNLDLETNVTSQVTTELGLGVAWQGQF